MAGVIGGGGVCLVFALRFRRVTIDPGWAQVSDSGRNKSASESLIGALEQVKPRLIGFVTKSAAPPAVLRIERPRCHSPEVAACAGLEVVLKCTLKIYPELSVDF